MLLLSLLLLLAVLPYAFGQATVAELRQAANEKMSRGDFVDAVPDLQQLIQILGSSKKTQTVAAMELVYYNLGICLFFSGQFGEAERAFQAYIKKYPHGDKKSMAYVYIADAIRFSGRAEAAITAYRTALKGFVYHPDVLADIYVGIARCYLTQDNWEAVQEPLLQAWNEAPNNIRRNWAATLLTTAYLKNMDIDRIYPLVPFLLRRNSFAERSIAFNMAALEAGDELFAEERYREALWIHRLVYPHDLIMVRSEQYLAYLERQAAYERRRPGDPRRLMRLQESMGEIEAEIKALEEIEIYDVELEYRIARGYMEQLRYREARELFLHHHTVAEGEKAEEALFLAFQCSAHILPWARAFEIGQDYMEKYPGGEWFEMISLAMGQMHAREENWPEVIRHLTETLRIRPNHGSAAECLYLMGYAHFMEEQFEQAVVRFLEIRQRFPQSELIPAVVYWSGMAYLFDAKYEEGAADFDLLLERYPGTLYEEDAAFRRAVCNYGMQQFELSEQRLATFVSAYPESKMIGEATMMRGDVAGAVGRPQDAVTFYQQAMQCDNFNIEMYNHCAFQVVRILFDDENYDALRRHLERYLETDREGSNVPLAVYWIGRALWQMGEQSGALKYYREAITEHGQDRMNIGVDMILDEWVGVSRKCDPKVAAAAWARLQEALKQAIAQGNRTTMLRLQRVLLHHPEIKPTEKERLLSNMLQEANFPFASPAVLAVLLDEAIARDQRALATQIANQIIDEFAETDYALDARMLLADEAISAAAEERQVEKRDELYETAIRHLGVIRAVYASSPEAAKALSILGRLYTERGRYKEADTCFKDILGVREWKQLWPDALYGRGECAMRQRDYLQASAYFERIYVMYGHYRAWAAKSYLRRAEALDKGHETNKARETLQEMLNNPDLAAYPEYAKAELLLKKLGS